MVLSAARSLESLGKAFTKYLGWGQALRDSGLRTEGGTQHCFLLCFVVSFPCDSNVQALLRIIALSNHIYE